ncbi:hypothetical protein EV360DRAFT_84897 [Lentinula raphanica]|nr:hypothetical protein EV360DRAFT_84897 [Lentinula raphanica]
MAHLHRHNDSEEIQDLPQLEPKLGQEGNRPHPHPSAPNKPPTETLVGFLALPIDKLKDMFSKFPTEEMKKAAEED